MTYGVTLTIEGIQNQKHLDKIIDLINAYAYVSTVEVDK